MARGRKLNSIESFKRALKSGYGLGTGSDYTPWLRVQDVEGALATGDKINGLKTKRVHHTLSPHESVFFYISEFNDRVLDIREQFPLLPLNLSMAIASHLGIQYPKVPFVEDDVPNVMTTDFLITTSNGYEAISVKAKNDLQAYSPEDEKKLLRRLEKIEIERVWWEMLEVDFKIFAPDDQDRRVANNISWATDPLRNNWVFPIDDYTAKLESLFYLGRVDYEGLIGNISERLALDSNDAVNVFRSLIAKKYIEVDLTQDFLSVGIVDITNIAGDMDEKYSDIA